VPWAFLIAIAIVAASEAALHFCDPMRLAHYGSDTAQRVALRDRAQYGLVPEVVLVGSSQMRQAVPMPDFLAEVQSRAGRPVSIGNYALRGAKMDVMYYLIRELCVNKRTPRKIIVGVSVRDLRGEAPDFGAIGVFCRFDDVWAELKTNGYQATQLIPDVVRNRMFGWCRMLRYRDYFSSATKRLVAPSTHAGDIARGELARELAIQWRSLKSSPMSQAAIRRRMRWSLELDRPAKPSALMVSYLARSIQIAKSRQVEIIFVEMPVSTSFKKALPKNFYNAFLYSISKYCMENNVRFIPASTTFPVGTDDDYYDAQHLNYFGSRKFSSSLLDVLGSWD
jgi:hypothetical protein